MKPRRLRLLLAEGSPGEAAAALHELYARNDPGLDLTVVSTIATLLATIKVVDPEVILLDLAMNLREPMDAVHLVHRTASGVPLIVFAEPTAKQQAVRSLADGALDYMLKGCMNAHTLERVLRSALERNTLAGLTDLLRDEVTGCTAGTAFSPWERAGKRRRCVPAVLSCWSACSSRVYRLCGRRLAREQRIAH